MKLNITTRLYEDFFDDNASQLQTSLKGLTDELDSPMDYNYRMIIRDSHMDIRDEKWIEKMKDKIDSIIQSTFIEFSSVCRRGEVEDVANPNKNDFIFGFNNTMRSPKVFRRFISQLFKILDTVDLYLYTKDGFPVMNLRYVDDMYVYELINAAYRLFPYDKFGFQPFDCFMDIEPERRLTDIANVEEVYYTGQYDGVIDLNGLVNDPNAKYKYEFNHLNTSKFYIPAGGCAVVDKDTFDNVVFKAKDLKFKNPYYQFGFDTNSGELFYSLDIMLGPCYIESMNIVVDLVISCTLWDSNDEDHGFRNDLPKFLHNVDELFGGRMPDVLRECITSKVRDTGDWDDEYDEDDDDDVLQ